MPPRKVPYRTFSLTLYIDGICFFMLFGAESKDELICQRHLWVISGTYLTIYYNEIAIAVSLVLLHRLAVNILLCCSVSFFLVIVDGIFFAVVSEDEQRFFCLVSG